MDNLLGKNHYKDYSELVAVAVENLWLLHREVEAKGALVIGDGPLPSPPKRPTPQASKRRPATAMKRIPPPSGAPSPPRPSPSPLPSVPFSIPDLFLLPGLEDLPVATLEIEPEKLEKEEIFTLDRWLFGQYNKLLPAKANCRAFARLTAGHPEGKPLEELAPLIVEAAALLGEYLADYDRRYQIGRDEALATAFPRTGPDGEKSRARYTSQFVGNIDSKGHLSGLLWDYRLIGFAPGNGPRLKLTTQGWALACLPNPILDGPPAKATSKFSPEETAFLLEHIERFVPVEAFAFRTLLQAISEGADTPDRLDEALRPLVTPDSNRSLSASFLTSQRSGALSRMADLGLIVRVRKGVRVVYQITEGGEHFLTQTQELQ